jgi:hypothetical protein
MGSKLTRILHYTYTAAWSCYADGRWIRWHRPSGQANPTTAVGVAPSVYSDVGPGHVAIGLARAVGWCYADCRGTPSGENFRRLSRGGLHHRLTAWRVYADGIAIGLALSSPAQSRPTSALPSVSLPCGPVVLAGGHTRRPFSSGPIQNWSKFGSEMGHTYRTRRSSYIAPLERTLATYRSSRTGHDTLCPLEIPLTARRMQLDCP